MGDAAKKVIEAADYTNAGTVEFLLDENKNFYFLEVNARVQVEHHITEMVTGVDLVRHQIMIAAGERLQVRQTEISQHGHAIEARIYAEDPENNFLPSPGKILFLLEPSGPGVRVDSGIYQGWNVPPHYDPILSKVITWAETRRMSIARMNHTLQNYIILGIKTNIGFLKRIMETKTFINSSYHTHFIDENEADLIPKHSTMDSALVAAAVVASEKEMPRTAYNQQKNLQRSTTPWQELGKWELCGH
jgi:acetyl/propionyl-CoA carboxylase alpha subunit